MVNVVHALLRHACEVYGKMSFLVDVLTYVLHEPTIAESTAGFSNTSAS